MDSEPRRSFLDRLRDLVTGARPHTSEDLEREITGLVDEGEARGFLSHRESEMIEAVLGLDETTTHQIMVPRIDLATVPHTAGVDEAIQVIVESGHSRIPIYQDDLDHIVGILHAKDLFPLWGKPADQVDIQAIGRAPFYVPQSMPINQLLAEFTRRRLHMAIVVDEYGGTAGLCTMEDILEEIVGDIVDEYDQEEPLIMEQGDGSLLVDARLEVEELSDRLATDIPTELPEGRFETVGGLITTMLGRVPSPQEEVLLDNLRMVVVGADERRVTQVLVQALPPLAVSSAE